jgi:hypothetical protein
MKLEQNIAPKVTQVGQKQVKNLFLKEMNFDRKHFRKDSNRIDALVNDNAKGSILGNHYMHTSQESNAKSLTRTK